MARSSLKRSVDLAAYAWLLWLFYRIVTFYFFPYKEPLKRYRRSPKAYALITGASGGIGYGYAQELLAHGFGVILLANNKEKLSRAAANLKSEVPNATIETISFDARQGNYDELATALQPFQKLPITLLINNVAGIPIRERFVPLTSYTTENITATINISAQFTTQCTRIMLPALIRNGPSAVINMGAAAEKGYPWIAVYCGCKAFVSSFATSLAREAKAEGWKVDAVCILLREVRSEFNPSPSMPGSPTSRQFAKTTLDRIEMAVDRNWSVVTPDWKHALLAKIVEALPEQVVQLMLVSGLSQQREAFAKLK